MIAFMTAFAVIGSTSAFHHHAMGKAAAQKGGNGGGGNGGGGGGGGGNKGGKPSPPPADECTPMTVTCTDTYNGFSGNSVCTHLQLGVCDGTVSVAGDCSYDSSMFCGTTPFTCDMLVSAGALPAGSCPTGTAKNNIQAKGGNGGGGGGGGNGGGDSDPITCPAGLIDCNTCVTVTEKVRGQPVTVQHCPGQYCNLLSGTCSGSLYLNADCTVEVNQALACAVASVNVFNCDVEELSDFLPEGTCDPSWFA